MPEKFPAWHHGLLLLQKPMVLIIVTGALISIVTGPCKML